VGLRTSFTPPAGLPPAAAEQLPPHFGQHVADLVEQLVRLVEPARGVGAAQRRPLPFPVFDAGEQAGASLAHQHDPSHRPAADAIDAGEQFGSAG
jgi:hypothetical protein